jgi:hypothetical protein
VIVAYWKARGFTAPVFIAVAGWAVTVAIQRSGASGLAIPAGRLRRVGLLFSIGLLLNWPGWGLDALAAGDRTVFAHLVSFGVLHTIAASIAVTAVVFAVLPERRARLLGIGGLALLAVAVGMRAPGRPESFAGIALEQAIGGTSQFPLFPWMVYFLAGSILGLLVTDAPRQRARLAGVGALLVAGTCWTGVGTMASNDPILVCYRIGGFLLLVGALWRVPAAVGRRMAPLGRASLGVYAIHVPLVYGWSTIEGLSRRIGPTLGLGRALLVATALLLFSLAAQWAIKSVWRAGRAALEEALGAAARAWATGGPTGS